MRLLTAKEDMIMDLCIQGLGEDLNALRDLQEFKPGQPALADVLGTARTNLRILSEILRGLEGT